MTKKQSDGLKMLMNSVDDALDVFKTTGHREQFIAVEDQIKAYREEFNAEFDIMLKGVKIF